MNNFAVDYAGLYTIWDNTFLFIIPGTLPTLNLQPSAVVAILF